MINFLIINSAFDGHPRYIKSVTTNIRPGLNNGFNYLYRLSLTNVRPKYLGLMQSLLRKVMTYEKMYP